MSLHTELKTLLDKAAFKQAKKLAPDQVDALAVNKVAGALLRSKGQPSK